MTPSDRLDEVRQEGYAEGYEAGYDEAYIENKEVRRTAFEEVLELCHRLEVDRCLGIQYAPDWIAEQISEIMRRDELK